MYYQFEASAITNAFRRLAAQMNDTTDVTRKIVSVLESQSNEAFREELDPSTKEKWAALSPQTEKWKKKQDKNNGILRFEGDLWKSLGTEFGNGFAVIGAAEPYGQYHQLGTTHMPARPFLGLGQNGIDEIVDILQREIKNALETA